MEGVSKEQSAEGYGRTWLVIAEQGGWWKASEVAAGTGDGLPLVQRRLASMVNDKYLARRVIAPKDREPRAVGAPERVEYAVLPECFVPRGLTAQSVARALAVQTRGSAT